MKACFSIPNVLTFLKVPLIWSGSMLNNFAPMYVCKTHTFQPRLLWNFEIIVCNIDIISLIYEFSFLDYQHPGSYGHQNRMDDAYSRQRVPPHQPHHQDYHPQVKKFVATFYFVLTSGF